MKMTVLVDNAGTETLPGEWGLSIHIESNGQRFLLDAGQSDLYQKNAGALGIDLSLVDHAVLSHAHHDHANGFASFFEVNSKADLWVSASCGENCWKRKDGGWKYIGIAPGILAKAESRLRRARGMEQVEEGVFLLPHAMPGFGGAGLAEGMFLREGEGFRPDDFCHEQSLVFDLPSGLVLFNSCSHAGADRIVREAAEHFPGRRLHAMIGGFHLCNKSAEQVRDFARRLRDTGVEAVCTGHCTGAQAFAVLKEELGDRAAQFCTGFTMEF
ncbi:MAG: MBL fold metallo-hydrolase [Desulfovibrionaceae bacterium]|nr:MBL fold metallo-hydrolase [Desulfovibrionaceae bacterium]